MDFFFLLKNFEIQTNRKFVSAHIFFSIVQTDWKKKVQMGGCFSDIYYYSVYFLGYLSLLEILRKYLICSDICFISYYYMLQYMV